MTRIATASVLLLLTTASGHAQGNPPGTVTTTAAVTGFQAFEADMGAGGRVGWSSVTVSAGLTRQFVPAFAAGVSIRGAAEDWRFTTMAAFAGSTPWRNLRRAGLGLNLSLALSRSLLVGASPNVEWAYDTGASSADAVTYGAVVSVLKVFGPSLTLGGGASVQRQFYSVKVSPFAIVNWKWNERFRIANAIPAGPEGGAGIEGRWTPAPDWELAAGGVLKSDRYRLADRGPYAGQVGETSSMPMFARLSRRFGAHVKTDLYAGAMAQGRLRIKNGDGDELASTHHAAAPALAATVSLRY